MTNSLIALNLQFINFIIIDYYIEGISHSYKSANSHCDRMVDRNGVLLVKYLISHYILHTGLFPMINMFIGADEIQNNHKEWRTASKMMHI